ncbi:ATP-binding protein [Anaerotignum propionicum]|uniref:histidine kinase n=1 Tax=Anaerotignum propionicum DSM 1682 TaxID=991789 RepID=A0A110A6Y4_ANAPI|nr:ATP-binding protein [Anaerotignum propionicum]AMJ40420.1 alkaline phosphatase synthesis sensor protein PhoR [Anaerotignum propionicum DSM 1682]SHE42632.1 two-component system, OmpR family, phosphate regulon sensor histidine kinase PhoR [[Clostridium] propionicum DSM 1682] [Anaerotignum propionicum DSM 1682]
MTKRIFRAIFGVAMVMMLSVVVLVLGMMYSYFSVQQQEDLRNQAVYIGAGVQKGGLAYLEQMQNPTDRITWIDGNGVVLFDSKANPNDMENHKERYEVSSALTNGEGFSQRYSRTLSEKTVYFALRLQDGTVIRISTLTTTPLALFFTMTQPLLLILVAAIVLSVLLAFQTAKKITKPINDVDLEQPELAVVYDELTPLLRRIAVQNKQIHRQMRELKCQKQEFDTITSNMQEGLLVLDAQGDVLSYNMGALHLMGINAPRGHISVFQLNRSEGFRRSVESALSGNHWEEKIQIGGRCCQLFANPVVQEDDLAGAILLFFDVTEREEGEKIRREFTANVSHELKTPLTSISGFAEIMKNGMVQGEDVPRFAEKIYDEAQRLIQLVQDIIKLSKLDEKQNGMEKETVDLADLIQQVVKRLEPVAENKGVIFSVSTVPVIFNGVKQVLQEMIYNLCDNAIQYNYENGKVSISLEDNEKEVAITVADTGMGIATVNQSRVFERFYRVNESRSKETEGTGLGLSIVKHGAILHNGKINLKSELKKGTTITLVLPK